MMKYESPPNYVFSVLSKLDKNGNFCNKIVQCPNCLRILNIKEINEIEELAFGNYISLQSLKDSLPKNIVEKMQELSCDFGVYEEVLHCYKNKVYDKKIFLTKKVFEGEVFGKSIKLFAKDQYLIEDYILKENNILQ